MSDIESAIVFSLRCNRRVDNHEGYWFDLISGETFGSDLWRLKQEPFSDSTITKAEVAVKQALSWLSKDKSITVRVYREAEQLCTHIEFDNQEFKHEL